MWLYSYENRDKEQLQFQWFFVFFGYWQYSTPTFKRQLHRRIRQGLRKPQNDVASEDIIEDLCHAQPERGNTLPSCEESRMLCWDDTDKKLIMPLRGSQCQW